MSLKDRIEIERSLKENFLKQIGENIGKDYTTASKEIKKHVIFKNIGAQSRLFNDYIHEKNCEFKEKGKLCNM